MADEDPRRAGLEGACERVDVPLDRVAAPGPGRVPEPVEIDQLGLRMPERRCHRRRGPVARGATQARQERHP